MIRFLKVSAVATLLLVFVLVTMAIGQNQPVQFDWEQLQKQVDALETRVTDLEQTVLVMQKHFEALGKALLEPEETSPITTKPATVTGLFTFTDGTHIVGEQLPPGTYQSTGSEIVPICVWQRLSGFSGSMTDVIASAITEGAAVVTIEDTDVGFAYTGCGTWTQVEA